MRLQTVLLLAALVIVLAFAGSAIFGLRRDGGGAPGLPAQPDSVGRTLVPESRGRIEVLNGAGRSGLAKLATERLRDAGFDVVQFGNASRAADSSAVIDRIGKIEVATMVGRALGIATIKSTIDTTRYVDATVILGKDWPPGDRK